MGTNCEIPQKTVPDLLLFKIYQLTAALTVQLYLQSLEIIKMKVSLTQLKNVYFQN